MSAAIAFVLLLCCAAGAGGLEQVAGDGIIVEYPKGYRLEADTTCSIYRSAREMLLRRLGMAPDEPVRVRLCATEAEFNGITGGRRDPATLGLAYPARNWIVINCARTGASAADNLAITVRHELCHLAIAAIERSGGRRVPYWFNEGLAVYTSGRLPLPGQGWLPTYVSRDVAIPLDQLAVGFPVGGVALNVAYEQSVGIVRLLARTYSDGAIVQICSNVADGRSFEQALVAVTGLTTSQLEEKWLKSLGVGSRMAAFVLRHVSLFTVASVLVIVAFGRYLMRRRAAMRRWSREEEPYPRDF